MLERQDEQLRTFLLETSVLERLYGPLCDVDTIKKHVGHVLGKLGAANRTEAVARARELNLL